MKLYQLAILFLISLPALGQDDRVKILEQRLSQLEARNEAAQHMIAGLKNETATLQQRINATIDSMTVGITRAQELQAQNERAMNLALDEYDKKFQEQNETFSFVQNQLDKKFNTQLILLSIFMIMFIVIVFILTRSVGRKAYSQNLANWNNFQEYMLKK